jgi:hypothetical protein
MFIAVIPIINSEKTSRELYISNPSIKFGAEWIAPVLHHFLKNSFKNPMV